MARSDRVLYMCRCELLHQTTDKMCIYVVVLKHFNRFIEIMLRAKRLLMLILIAILLPMPRNFVWLQIFVVVVAVAENVKI